MKKMILIFAFGAFLTSCGENNTTKNKEEQKIVEVTPDLLFAQLIDLDQKLVKADLSFDKKVAQELYTTALDFTEKFPSNEKTPDAIELAIKGAEGIGKYDEAINLLHKLITDYEETEKTPSYMYNKARILEEKLGKKENAKAAYNALIERFPNDDLSKSAQEYLNMNYIDMTDAEIIEFLNNKNQETEE